jgi:hypothetical protein
VPTLLLAASLALANGCAHYRASPTGVGGAAVTTEGKETVWNLAWGLVSTPAAYVDNCQDGPLAEVTVTSNLAFAILTVATLGLVSPAVVEWKCGKCASEGSLGEAAPAAADTLAWQGASSHAR